VGVVYSPKPRRSQREPEGARKPWANADHYPIGTIYQTFWSKQYWVVCSRGYDGWHDWRWIPESEVPEPYEQNVPPFLGGVSIPE
jgi:hypothetical protein